ncbi:MAG: carbohydrate ABC transporter permease [Phycisphaerales bacterium]
MRRAERETIPGWRKPSAATRLAVHAVTWLTALTMVLPFWWMLSTSLKSPVEAIAIDPTLLPAGWPWEWRWSNYAEAWRSARLGDFYANSLIVAVVVTSLSVLHNALAGFAFAKLRFAGRRTIFVAILFTMMMPFQVYFIFAYLICDRLGYIDNYQALIVPFLATAFGIFYMRQAISTLPDDLLAAGRLDGFTDFELFWHIALPSIRPAVGALAIFTFMGSWNSFFWPLIVIDSNDMYTLPLAVNALASGLYVDSWPVQMAAASAITVPIVIVFLLFQRRFVEGLTLTGMKG